MAELQNVDTNLDESTQYYDTTWVNDGPLFEKLIEKLLNYHPGTFGVFEYPPTIQKNLLTDFEVTLDTDGNPDDPSKMGNFVIHSYEGEPDEITGYSPLLLVSTIFGEEVEKENADPDDPNKTSVKYTQVFFLYAGQNVYRRESGSTEWKDVSLGSDTNNTIIFHKDSTEPIDKLERTVWLDTSGDTPVWKVCVEQNDGSWQWKEIGIPGSMDSTIYDPTNKRVPVFGYINDEIEKVSGGYGRFLKHVANELPLRHITAEQRERWNQIPTAEELSTTVENAETSITNTNADLYENELETNKRTQELQETRGAYISHIDPVGTEATDPHITFQKAQSWDKKAEGNHHHDLDNHVTIHAENIVLKDGKRIPSRYLPSSIKERVYEITSLEELADESITNELRNTKYHTGNVLVIEDPSGDYKKRRWFKIINPALIGTESYLDGILEFTKDFTPSNDLYWAYIANKPNTATGFKISDEVYTKASYEAKYGKMETSLVGIMNNLEKLSSYKKVYFPENGVNWTGALVPVEIGFVHTFPIEYPIDFSGNASEYRDLNGNLADAVIELQDRMNGTDQGGLISAFSFQNGCPNIYWTVDDKIYQEEDYSNQWYAYNIGELCTNLWEDDIAFDLNDILTGNRKIDITSVRYLPEASVSGTSMEFVDASGSSYTEYFYADSMKTLMNVYDIINQSCNVFIIENNDGEFIRSYSVNEILNISTNVGTNLLGTCRGLRPPLTSIYEQSHFVGQLIGLNYSDGVQECYFLTNLDLESPEKCKIKMDYYYTHAAAYYFDDLDGIHPDETRVFKVAFAAISGNTLRITERYFSPYENPGYFVADSEFDTRYANYLEIPLEDTYSIKSMTYVYPEQTMIDEGSFQRLLIVLNGSAANKVVTIHYDNGNNFFFDYVDVGDLNPQCTTYRRNYGAILATDSNQNIHLINRNMQTVQIFSPPQCIPEEVNFVSIKPLRIPIVDCLSDVQGRYLENMYRVVYEGAQSKLKYIFVLYENPDVNQIGIWESFSGTGIENIISFDYAASSVGLELIHILDKISYRKLFYTYKPDAQMLGGCMNDAMYRKWWVYGLDVSDAGILDYEDIEQIPVDFVLKNTPFILFKEKDGNLIITLDELQSNTWDELRLKYPRWQDFLFDPSTASYVSWSYLKYKELTWNDLASEYYNWYRLESANPSSDEYIVDSNSLWTLYSRKFSPRSGEYVEIIIGVDDNGQFMYYPDLENLKSSIQTVKLWKNDDIANKIIETNDMLKALTSNGFELFDMYSALPLTWNILNKLNYSWKDFQNHYTSWNQIMNGLST